MGRRLRRFGLLSKALLFTIVIHGVLMVFLFYNFNWTDNVKRGGAGPIEAVAVPARDLEAQQAARALEAENKRKAEEEKRKREAEEQRKAEELKKQQEVERKRKAEEKKKREAEEQRKAEELKKQQEVERKRKAEEKKKREAEEQRKAEELKKQREAERKRKAEEEKKKREAEERRKAEELKKQQEAEKKRKEEEAKRRRAEELREQLAQEQLAKTRDDAADALSALVDRIASAVENNWRRPPASRAGLTLTIRVKVARDGRVITARVTRTSGDPLFDQSAERAVQKASPLPFPSNPEYYEFINEFDFKFSPDE